MWEWLKLKKTRWTEFYNFLEDSARTAKEMLTNESINAALTAKNKKQKCPSCTKSYPGKCNKAKNTAVVQGGDKTCPVCNKSAHKYRTKTRAEGIWKRIKDCPGFKAALDDQKQEMIKKIKVKNPVCSKCSSWSHKGEDCNWKTNCPKCNEVHINDMCTLKKFFSCSVSAKSNACYMSLQDIPVHNSNNKARVMFDNGSEITLVSNFFTKKNNLPFEEATYTLAGIGSNPTTYNNGKIYTIPLLDSNQEIIFIKAFSVDSILSEKIG